MFVVCGVLFGDVCWILLFVVGCVFGSLFVVCCVLLFCLMFWC